MKILITGGLGTIGSGLVKKFIQNNDDVYYCDLRHEINELSFSIKSDEIDPKYIRCDIGEYREIERIFKLFGPFDYVYNCAAEFGRWNGEDFYEQVWKTNVIGMKHILRLQEQYNFKLIHFSSSEIYGDYTNIMTENVMDDYEIKQLNDYAISKWTNELQIKNSITQFNTQTVVVRLFNTYGPGEYYSPYRSVNCRFLYCALNKLPWTVFRGHFRTSTYLNDTINTLFNISNNFKSGETYNIGGNYLHSIEELSDLIIEITKSNKKLVQYKNSEQLTTKIKKVDVSKAINDLNHQNTVTLKEGLILTMEWMKKNVYSR